MLLHKIKFGVFTVEFPDYLPLGYEIASMSALRPGAVLIEVIESLTQRYVSIGSGEQLGLDIKSLLGVVPDGGIHAFGFKNIPRRLLITSIPSDQFPLCHFSSSI